MSPSVQSHPEPTHFSPERWEQVKVLFAEITEAPEQERHARLAAINDSEIAREVCQLVASFNNARTRFLNSLSSDTEANFGVTARFNPGQLIASRFVIGRLLGTGGMGEVYEAEDLQSRERVALKFIRLNALPVQEALSRFRREIHIARKVTHQNVCRLHEIFSYTDAGSELLLISMEMIEGETVADRLTRAGPFSETQATHLVKQLLIGLQAAHAAGVVHRDLKPSNLMIPKRNPDRIIITDFGLARTQFEDSVSVDNRIAGTLAYMAPEQIHGEFSAQSDLYAVGVIFCEMLSGHRPFQALSEIPIMADGRQPPPQLKGLGIKVSRRLECLIAACLEPAPSRRIRSATQLLQALEGDGPLLGLRIKQTVRRPAGRWVLALILMSIITLGVWEGRQALSGAKSQRELALRPVTTDPGFTTESTLSDDGQNLAYVSDRAGKNLELYVQHGLDQTASSKQLTDDGFDKDEPNFSPDGRWIAYRSAEHGGTTLVISSLGGVPRRVAAFGHDPRFSPNGNQIAYWVGDDGERPQSPNRIFLVPSAGGECRRIAPEFASARWPVWIDDQHLLFEGLANSHYSYDAAAEWYVLDLRNGRPIRTRVRELLKTRGMKPFHPLGNIVGRTLVFSARWEYGADVFSCTFGHRDWSSSPALKRLTTATNPLSSPWISRTGVLSVASWSEATLNVWKLSLGPKKDFIQITDSEELDSSPTASRDGHLIAFNRTEGEQRTIYSFDDAHKRERPLINNTTERYFPTLSPSGSLLAYSALESGGHSIFVADTLTQKSTRICASCGDPMDWLRSEKQILMASNTPREIQLLDVSSGARQSLLHDDNADLAEARVSPSGQWIAFRARSETDSYQIFVAPLHIPGPVMRTSWIAITGSDSHDDKPRWALDGKTLYFVSTRDSFRCLWQQRIEPESGKPVGIPTAVRHFHRQSELTLGQASPESLGLAVGGGFLFFNATRMHGNIWVGQVGTE